MIRITDTYGRVVRVDTAPYERATGHAPRGRGTWVWSFDGSVHERDYVFNGGFTSAKIAAKRLAAARGYNMVLLLPPVEIPQAVDIG
jgi:hypothetical protein